jgi:MinD-like ATPase involved in chromosome partitioning or flagellar assembly
MGATTAALLLAAVGSQSGETLLVEADAAGGVLAARVPQLGSGLGLEQVAFDHDTSMHAVAQPFAGTNVVTAPADAFRAWSAVGNPRTNWIDQLRRVPGLVIVDVGSLRGGAVPAWRIVEQADSVVMCTTAEPASLVATLAWLDAKGQSAPNVNGLSGGTERLLVIDAPVLSGERLGADQVRRELSTRCVGWWPWQPTVVDLVLRGATPEHRRLRSQPLLSATRSTLAELLDGSPR